MVDFIKWLPNKFLPVPIAQLDRAFDYGSKGWEFESSWVRHLNGKWLSLVERLVWDQDVAGSNPVFPTTCRCSLVVKLQPSKLVMWVRFPSPAPFENLNSAKRSFFIFKKIYGAFCQSN